MLRCTEENKKIAIDGQGNISIIEAGIPNDEIWYTSSDGNIVTPTNMPIIISNTYSDGKGVIKFKSNITSIATGAFADSRSVELTSIEIPNSITNIENLAFANCHNVTSIIIPNRVTSIKDSAFGGIQAKIIFSKLYSTYTDKIFIAPISTDITYNVEFNISKIPTGYNISSMLPNVDDGGKYTLTYNIYTDYAPCKDQALALITTKIIVNVYHIDGTPWE